MLNKIIKIYNKVKSLKYAKISYAQEGEDLLLERIFEYDLSGFYIDVGAHHPKRFSNTYLFYKKGWHGINIDAMPHSMKPFNKVRPKDTNLEVGISQKKQILTYYMFDEPALNGFNKDVSDDRERNTSYKILDKKEITTIPLSDLLDKYLPQNQKISFLSIDVEGLDLEVLKSNNWHKYQPTIILVEMLHSKVEDIVESEIHSFLNTKGYSLYCKTPNTAFYKKD